MGMFEQLRFGHVYKGGWSKPVCLFLAMDVPFFGVGVGTKRNTKMMTYVRIKIGKCLHDAQREAQTATLEKDMRLSPGCGTHVLFPLLFKASTPSKKRSLALSNEFVLFGVCWVFRESLFNWLQNAATVFTLPGFR